MNIGFWNIEKGCSEPDVEDEAEQLAFLNTRAGERWAFVRLAMTQWLRPPPDVLILAEVTPRKGTKFIKALAQQMTLQSNGAASYDGSFFPSARKGGGLSPCCMGVVWNTRHPALSAGVNDVDFFWMRDWTRPMIVVTTTRMVIGGIHAKSRMSQVAAQEIFEAVIELNKHGLPAILVGDMNISFDSYDKQDLKLFASLGWRKYHPGMHVTFTSRRYQTQKILDYAFSNVSLDALPPFLGYDQWKEVDHAPVQYSYRTPGDKYGYLVGDPYGTGYGNNNNNNNNPDDPDEPDEPDEPDDPDYPPIPPPAPPPGASNLVLRRR